MSLFLFFMQPFFVKEFAKKTKNLYTIICLSALNKRNEVDIVEQRGVVWVVVILIIMLLGYVIPYTWLSGIDAWYGSLLFWSVITVATISVNVMISSAWRD